MTIAEGNMAKQVLQEEFNKLRFLARQVGNSNEEYRTGCLAHLDTETEKCDRISVIRSRKQSRVLTKICW